MLTKYILHIGESEYELCDDDLMNWGDVKCSYKREDYGGVVRSFTSQFEFVNHARKLLLELYLSEGFNAKASVSVHTQNNSWGYDKRFECELDFSTISWESHVLRINCVDNSLSALIKANKGTKYEFVVGEDLARDSVLGFDRMPMLNSVTYEFTGGAYSETSADILVTFNPDELSRIGNVGKEIEVNGAIDWQDDQTDDLTSYILKTTKDLDVELQYDIEWRKDWQTTVNESGSTGVILSARIRRNGSALDISGDSNIGNGGVIATPTKSKTYYCGSFPSSNGLPDPSTLAGDPQKGPAIRYATVAGYIWVLEYRGRGYEWLNTGKETIADYFGCRQSGRILLSLKAGDQVYIGHSFLSGNQPVSINFISSKFIFSWTGTGTPANIDVFTPRTVAKALIKRMIGNNILADVSISSHDPRMVNTFLMAAESARGISGAKFYSSFNDFCDWMSAVFGYVYLIGEETASRYQAIRECGEYESTPWYYEADSTWHGSVSTDNIIYIAGHGRFFYHESGTSNLFQYWDGCQEYNSNETGYARTDTLFRIKELSENDLYCFGNYEGGYMVPERYDGSIEDLGKTWQTIRFAHRSELFDPAASVLAFAESKNHKYSVDAGFIYSTITAGYDKKDYGSINGRDEFNFSNTYSTGCTVTDKTLSLISKYRADCFGIEFAVQKRGQETTDTTSDKDVFFLLCTKQSGRLVPDRSISIGNAISSRMFNGAFSPIACIRANAGFIGLQAEDVTLKFASSTGNSDIVIDGEPLTSDITLDTPLATCATLEFDTDAPFTESHEGRIIEVSDGERRYRGFLKEVDTMYARAETTKCKIIVKEVLP